MNKSKKLLSMLEDDIARTPASYAAQVPSDNPSTYGDKFSFLVIDPGRLHVGTAQALANEGHEVLYFNPWQTAYSQYRNYAPGTGLPGVTKVQSYEPHLDKVDCIVIPDVGMGETANWLRSKGYRVFGAGKAEELEQDRGKSFEIMERLGLKYPQTHKVQGVKGVYEFMEACKSSETNQRATGDYFSKINIFRGDIDTFPVTDPDDSKCMLDTLAYNLGPHSDEMPIYLQEKVPGIECGWDLIFNGKEFLRPGLIGFESGGSYVGHVTDDFSIFEEDLEKLAKYLREMDYRGFISCEAFYDGKDLRYIDWTTRYPMPLGMIYNKYVDGLGELFMKVADGSAESSGLPLNKYVGCMDITTEEAMSKWLPLKADDNTLFLHYMGKGDKRYAVPGVSLIGATLGQGNNLEELKADVLKNSESVKIFFAGMNTDFVDDIIETYIEPLTKQGLKFGEWCKK